MSQNENLENEFEEEDTQEGKYLTFMIGNETYAIEICFVTEIIGILNITRIPDMATYVKGVINLRGKVIPVIDVRLRFNMEEIAYTDRTCTVVVNFSSITVGLIVDAVSEVIDIPAANIQEPPQMSKTKESQYIKGFGKIDNQVKIILDIDKLLYEKDLENITIDTEEIKGE